MKPYKVVVYGIIKNFIEVIIDMAGRAMIGTKMEKVGYAHLFPPNLTMNLTYLCSGPANIKGEMGV